MVKYPLLIMVMCAVIPSLKAQFLGGNGDGFAVSIIGSPGGEVSLPISLVFFEATTLENSVKLKWETASEINNDFFTIEKSKNGIDWLIVGKVKGAGNSSTHLSYATFDESPFQGLSYYRLKQTDYDGKYTYSKVVVVNRGAADNSIVVYPNPVANLLAVQLNATMGKVQVSVYNSSGYKVKSFELDATCESLCNIDVSMLSCGNYALQVVSQSSSNQLLTAPFIKIE